MQVSNRVTFCDFCGKSVVRSNLKRHINEIHGKSMSCDFCDYTFKSERYMKMHIDTEHLGKKHLCKMCDYKCRHKETLYGHIKVKHMKAGIKCEICDYMTAKERDMKSHKVKHMKIKCELCDYMTANETYMKKHMVLLLSVFHRRCLSSLL